MARLHLRAADRPEVPPLAISPRLRSQLAYFAEVHAAADGADEYRFDLEQVARWLDEGVFHLVSPLDTANHTEIELSEEQEALLEWLTANGVRHARVAEGS